MIDFAGDRVCMAYYVYQPNRLYYSIRCRPVAFANHQLRVLMHPAMRSKISRL